MFLFQAEDGIRDGHVTGVQTCALPISASYCRDTSVDFLLRARDSLSSYQEKNLPTGHKGGMRNIRTFLQQRKQWLEECDQYLSLTGQGRVFRDEATTQQILDAIDAVSSELERLMGSGTDRK